MPRRQPNRQPRPIPVLWLMTDERMGDGLWPALERLPRGAGIVFRHHATPMAERRRLFAAVLRIARRRGLVLVRAGATAMRGEMGVHARRGRRGGQGRGVVTWPAHSRMEAVAGVRAGAHAVFVSPVFPTRSHPGAAALGVLRAAAIVRGVSCRRIALGGLDRRRFGLLKALKFDGWAAIDAWNRD